MKKIRSFFVVMIVAVLAVTSLAACGSSGIQVQVSAVAVGDTQMRYCVFGTGEKTMVILPGLSPSYVTDSAKAIAKRYSGFSEAYTVYVFDVKDAVPEGYTIEEMAEDTVTAMESLGLSDINLLGISLGGEQALCIESEHPDLISHMVLCGSITGADSTYNDIINNWISIAQTGDGSALKKQIAENIYSEATLKSEGSSLYKGGNKLTEEDLNRFVILADALVDLDLTEQAMNMYAKTYVIGSKGDQLVDNDTFMDMVSYVRQGKLYEYDDSYGHAVYDEADDFPERVWNFFEDN